MTTTAPTARSTDQPDFKVADLSLADFGRKEIDLAEHEMPGLIARRERHAARPRRRGPVGLVQHLLHPGPRRGGDRRPRHPRVRLEGRDPRGVLVVHRTGVALAG